MFRWSRKCARFGSSSLFVFRSSWNKYYASTINLNAKFWWYLHWLRIWRECHHLNLFSFTATPKSQWLTKCFFNIVDATGLHGGRSSLVHLDETIRQLHFSDNNKKFLVNKFKNSSAASIFQQHNFNNTGKFLFFVVSPSSGNFGRKQFYSDAWTCKHILHPCSPQISRHIELDSL